ncbi:multidrug resistance protein [Microdochium nivale]|nr:multidrug resistance protein [Microdochium nivale]
MLGDVGVMFLQPVTIEFRKRLSYLIGSLILIAGFVCGLAMTNDALYFAFMALAGIGSAPSYSTSLTSLLDMTFLHQKGQALGLYGAVVVFGNFLPPLAAG